MKKMLIVICILSISACSGASSSSGGSNSGGSNSGKSKNKSIDISGKNVTVTINEAKKVDLDITGIDNIIYIESDIGTLDVTGIGNNLYFSSGVTVDECEVSGIDNYAEKEDDVTMTCEVSGTNNIGF